MAGARRGSCTGLCPRPPLVSLGVCCPPTPLSGSRDLYLLRMVIPAVSSPQPIHSMEPSTAATTSASSLDGSTTISAGPTPTPSTCPSAPSNTSASQLFLSMRLTTPLDVGNTTVQELLLAKSLCSPMTLMMKKEPCSPPPCPIIIMQQWPCWQTEDTRGPHRTPPPPPRAVRAMGPWKSWLGTAAAVPVTTEGPFAATSSQSEGPTALLLGTVGTSTVNDNVMAESIHMDPTTSPSFPSRAEPDSVTMTTAYNSHLGTGSNAGPSTGEITQAPTGVPQAGVDVATSLDATPEYQSGLASATAAAIVVTPQPNFTPSTEHNVTGTTTAAPLGSTPAFADVPASATREGAGLESTTDAIFLLSATIPTTAGTQPVTTTPLHPHINMLPTDTGAEVEGVTLPGDSHGDGRVPTSIPIPGAEGLLPTPWGEVLSGTVGDTPGWAALESGGEGDAANGDFGRADLSQLPPENVTALETAENPGQKSLLTDQTELSPANLLGPGDGDRQEAPAVLPSSPGSALADSEATAAPGVRGDTASLLPATDVQSNTDFPAPDTGVALPTGAVGPAESSLQTAPWLSPAGEEQSQLGTAPPALTDASGAPSSAFPAPGVAAGSLPATDDGVEAVVSPDFSAALGVSLPPPLEGSQPWETAADGPSTGLNSALGATNPSPSASDGAAWLVEGQQAQGDSGAGDTTQSENAEDSSPSPGSQSDTSPAASSTQKGPSDIAPEAALHPELFPAPAPGNGALAPALSPDGPAAPGHDLSGVGGAGSLPTEVLGAPSAALPPPSAVDGTVFEAEDGTEGGVSPDLGAAPEEPASPSLGSSQPWDTAVGAPEDIALPGAEGPGSDINSVLDAPSSVLYEPTGPPSPFFGVQPGAGLGMPGADGPDTSLSSALGAANPSPYASDGAALPSAGEQAQGNTGAGDTTQSEDSGDGSPYANAQSDTSPAASSTQQGSIDTAPGAELRPELFPAPAPGEGTLAPALSPDGPPAPGHDISGAGGAETIEVLGSPSAALPPPSAVDGTVFEANNGAEVAVSPDLGAAPEEPASPPLGSSQPWDTAIGAPEDTALPGAEGPGSDINSVLDAPSSVLYEPTGPPSPFFGVQPGAGLGMPGADGPDTSLSSALGAANPLSSTPDIPALPAVGEQAQSNAGTEDTTQSEDAGDSSPSIGSQSDTSPAASSTQQGPADTAPGAELHPELFPAPAPGDGALAPALFPDGPPAPSHDLSGAGGAGPIEALGFPSAALPPPSAVDGTVFEANNGAEAAVSPDLGAAPEEPASLSLGSSQPWDTAIGAPEDTALPAAEEPGNVFSSTLNAPTSSSYGLLVPPSPDSVVQPDRGLTVLGEEEQAPGGVSSTAILEPSLSLYPGTGLSPGTGLLPGAGFASNSASSIDVLAVPSVSESDGAAAPIPEAAPGSDIPSQDSPYEKVGPELSAAQGTNSAGGVAQAEIPESQNPYTDTSPASSSTQKGPSDIAPEAALHPELFPAPAPGNGALAPALSPDGPAAPGHDLSGVGGAGSLPTEVLGAPSAALPPPSAVDGTVFGTKDGAEAAVRPNLGAAIGEPGPPPLGSSQSWDTAAGAPEDTALPGAEGPGSDINSVLDAPSSVLYGPAGPPSPDTGVKPVPAVPLYGYGARENDREYVQRKVDFNSPLFKPETGFPFGKTLRDSLYSVMNGPTGVSSLCVPNPQEFLTLNSEKPPFVRDVEAKVRRYVRSSYSAAWTLKITWEKAPAYGARGDSRRTNTYQAVLTTDGFRAYVLILYQDGGMQWDYTQLPATNALIGYTSGDGYYRNDDLSQGSPAAKYRPDRYRGYNTDLRGLWLYKLESRVGINYRLKCLAWTGRQQEPRAWSQDLPACPCSLQQGQQDPRFRSSRGGK
ncbi:hypothetical protein ASZ78_000922 [Callipepla squamata]|uniref:NIDO domain-containing protein n=1 Tax=Callipepla squamata TaxID=9009 RepID=A0A226MPL7_CALSU|nr:hypothetical protein ASZ78_000922 [Callipepla squamata]